MTEEQKQAAARRLCELRGIDPDSLVVYTADGDVSPTGNTIAMVLRKREAWRTAISEIDERVMMDEAIAHGRSV